MSSLIGKNTPSAEMLRSYVDRVEHLEAQIKALQDDKKAVIAEAKASGFVAEGIRYVVKVRKMKPHDRQEAETLRDLYMHAMGMDAEPPLFRQIEAIAHESVGSEKLLEAFKLLVPPSGDIIVTIAGKRRRIWRDKEGNPQSEDYTPPEVATPSENKRTTLPPATKKDVPACSANEAEALGRQAAKENCAIIENPFPYGDERRPRWDLGWRKETGNDGMGPG